MIKMRKELRGKPASIHPSIHVSLTSVNVCWTLGNLHTRHRVGWAPGSGQGALPWVVSGSVTRSHEAPPRIQVPRKVGLQPSHQTDWTLALRKTGRWWESPREPNRGL